MRKPNPFFFSPITAMDVKDTICNLKGSNSMDIRVLNSRIIKHLKDNPVRPFTHIVNACVWNGIFPSLNSVEILTNE